jgi:hypothetical protein
MEHLTPWNWVLKNWLLLIWSVANVTQVGTCPNILGFMSLPNSTPQRHAAAIPGIKLSLPKLKKVIILWNLRSHYCVQNNPPLLLVLCQINPVLNLSSCHCLSFSYLCLRFPPNFLFPCLQEFCMNFACLKCPAHSISVDSIILTIFGSTYYEAPHYVIISSFKSLLPPLTEIFSSKTCSQTPSSLNERVQISHLFTGEMLYPIQGIQKENSEDSMRVLCPFLHYFIFCLSSLLFLKTLVR